jgi:hypothetical protein
MPRSKTDTVEYFPHIARQGKTLYILEGKYGNDGYSFWFKLLEVLATSEGHFYDASSEPNWQYLVARAKVKDDSASEILSLLGKLGNIDNDLWKNHKIIWCQALVDNLSEVYRKRKRDLPMIPQPIICDRNTNICDRNMGSGGDSATAGTQSKVEKSKEKERKDIATPGEPVAALKFYSCQFFEVDFDYRLKLAKEFPALTDDLLKEEFSKMEDWIIDNKSKKKFKSNGHLGNERSFIGNWLRKVVVEGGRVFAGGASQPGIAAFMAAGKEKTNETRGS